MKDKKPKIKFGKYLKNLREKQNLTEIDVAEKLNVKIKCVKLWEKELDYPNIDQIYKLADLYWVSCDEMLRAKEISQINNTFLARFFANVVGYTFIGATKIFPILILGLGIFALAYLAYAASQLAWFYM